MGYIPSYDHAVYHAKSGKSGNLYSVYPLQYYRRVGRGICAHGAGERNKGIKDFVPPCAEKHTSPIITLIGMNLATLVCGSFIIESVFGWPGIGTFAMEAIGKRDYPIIMAYVMLSGFILVIGNFCGGYALCICRSKDKTGDRQLKWKIR